MKVKTITCHDVYNVGASLQAYALSSYIKNLGHDIEIIDYKPDYLSNHFPLWGVNNSRYDKPLLRELYSLAKLPGRIKAYFGNQKKEFDSFSNEYLPVTKQCYKTNDSLKASVPEADIFFAGSDQIWNTLFNNGKDPAFYLDFVPEGKIKASYAASFATDEVIPEYKEQVFRWLSTFDFISVRESTGLSILKDLGIEKGQQVLDPVFLLSKEQWLNIAVPIGSEEPFLFFYDFDRNEKLFESVKKYADENGLKIYSWFSNKLADRSFFECGPRTFLSLILDANVIVSNSFHGSAFSVIFEKNFWVANRNEAINSRMRDLLSLFKLEDRMITDYEKDYSKEINYDNIHSVKMDAISQSKKYIDEVLRSFNKND